jgi:diaminohydroxyphosphoribosylaminopyrimidine deaminase/5-amino-6-(5-phosphoribosylamino)uracil reductase
VLAECGLLAAEATEINLGFVARMTRARPWLRLKLAASLDGKTALRNGASQWLTGPAARQDGHRWRARACAILTGIGTVRHDDPQLNVRGVEDDTGTLRQPLKVVVDSRLELSPEARVLRGGGVLVAAAVADHGRAAKLAQAGAEVLVLSSAPAARSICWLCSTELARRGINEVHAEAGFGLSGSLLSAGLVDELLLYLAPCLIGDAARGMFDLPPLESLAGKRSLVIRDVRALGGDLRLLARFT